MRYVLLRLKRFCGFVTGIVFFIGGILKLMDPVGAGLVMEGYLDFLHIGFLGFAAKPLGVIAALTETVIGTALITGVWRKHVAMAAMALQGFFTLLTLLLVIFKPDMDCGCFGEAVHLTHMQTFIKNIVLCALLAAYFFPKKMLGRNTRSKFVSFAIVTASVAAFCLYSCTHIPLIDFTDFKPGSVLSSAESAGSGDFESEFIYEKEGRREAFSLDNLPDSTWTFVCTETRTVRNEENPVLSFYNEAGEYMDSLAVEGKVMVVSIYRPEISRRKYERIERFIKDASEEGYRVLLLSSGESKEIQDALTGEIYICDYKTLLTLNRSNGGATYFDDGCLVRKWSRHGLPDMEKLQSIRDLDKTEVMIGYNTKGSLGFQGFLLYVFAVMLLL